MNNLFQSIAEHAVFVLEFAAVILALFLVSYVIEKLVKKKTGNTQRILNTRRITMIALFSAIAAILMLFEFPLPFAPFFYEVDLSELPILIGSFAFGPVAGVMMEFIKVLLKLILKGTSTAFVGDLANFAVGCSLILPASIFYLFKKTKKGAVIACILGTLCMAVFGTAFNAVYLLPAFSELFGMPLDSILAMGAEINPLVNGSSIVSFVCFCVAPLNLLKGGVVSLITLLVYKHLSPIIKAERVPIGDGVK